MRRTARRIVTLWLFCSWLVTGWVLSQNPFAAPLIARSADEARVAFQRAMALRVTPDWLTPRLVGAVIEEDSDLIRLYRDLADDHGIALPADLTARADAVLRAEEGILATASDCATCAYDIAACPTIAMVGACAIPVELTPLGDLNALRRVGVAWSTGEEIDRLDAGLALVGLAASGAILVSGGTSATAKVGATMLRLARRSGALSLRMSATLGDAVSGLVRWDRLPAVLAGDLPLDDAVDAARWSGLTALAEDAGTLSRNTSGAEALSLLRRVDSAEDLARLARVSQAAGPDTRKVIAVLGADALRLLDRVSHLALAAIGLVTLVATQIATLVLGLLARILRVRPGTARHRGRTRPVA